MTTVTDPARELAEIADKLCISQHVVGDKFLAEKFGVERWSTEFFKVITCILERADFVAEIIQRSNMDDDHKANAVDDLARFKDAFRSASLNQHWDQGGLAHVREAGRPLQYLSPAVRSEIRYPKLSKEETAELLGLIDQYLAEVRKSDEAPEFIRQSIIDGLTAFRFQLEKIGWMGAGYALTAFREIMIVYEVASRQFGGQPNPDPEAFLSGLLKIIQSFKAKADAAQGWKDTGQNVWNFYQLGSAVITTPLLMTGQIQIAGQV